MKSIRISKLFSEKGIASRRTTEKWFENSWIYVNNKLHTSPGELIHPLSLIFIHPDAFSEVQEQITLVLNKPPGYVSTFNDPKYEHALSLITKNNFYASKKSNFKISYKNFNNKNLGPVGRLDAPSRGLIIYTQDGTLAKKIIGPNANIKKEYLVKVVGEITEQKIKKLQFGLSLDGQKLKRAEVSIADPKSKTLKFILQEGKNRQIRRMCHLVNLKVEDLLRVQIGRLKISDLPEGQWAFVTAQDILD